MFSYRNIYGNLGVASSYEESIPEGSEQEALANDEGQAVTPQKARNFYLSLLGILLLAFILGR